MGCQASVHSASAYQFKINNPTPARSLSSKKLKQNFQSSKKIDLKSNPSQSFKNEYIPPAPKITRQGSAYRRSRVSLSKIDIDGLIAEMKDSSSPPPQFIDCKDLFLTIVSAKYDDLDCSNELQDLVSNNGELHLKGGPHAYVLKRKPIYHKLFELIYCYQTDILMISKRIEEIDQKGILLDAPGSHELSIAEATLNGVDITEHITKLVENSKTLLLIPNTSSFLELLLHVNKTNDDGDASTILDSNDVDSMVLSIAYAYQTPNFTVSCIGNEDLLIPNYQTVLRSQLPDEENVEEEVKGEEKDNNDDNSNISNHDKVEKERRKLSHEEDKNDDSILVPTIPKKGIRRTMSHGHMVISKKYECDSMEIQSFPLSTRSKAMSIIKAVPLTMKGYINKESSNSKTWVNRYFILDSTESLAHLAYYRRASSQMPYGKDLKGEISLVDFTMSVDGDILILRSKQRPNEGVVLEIKEQDYKQKWVKAIEDHMLYAELEIKKQEENALNNLNSSRESNSNNNNNNNNNSSDINSNNMSKNKSINIDNSVISKSVNNNVNNINTNTDTNNISTSPSPPVVTHLTINSLLDDQ